MSYQNFYATKLDVAASASDTTLQVKQAPTITNGWLVLEARNPSNREIVRFTGVSGNILTGVTRGQQGTNGIAHAASTSVEMNPTASDFDELYTAFNGFSATNGSGWFNIPQVPSAVSYNGQRSYQVTFPSVDLTNIFQPGTRIRTTRNTPAPTQSTSLNGTTQYWLKTAPNKMTFTDDFVVSAWVKLSSYPPSSGVVISRYNGTSGWGVVVGSDGTIDMYGRNGAAANVSRVTSYQAIPLNKWVHIAVQLDMSAFTATTTTSYIMIDGVDVPAYVTRGGTNPTTLAQAGNLEIGSQNGGTVPFPGKIAQVAVFNAKVTQATMRGYISQGLTGSEPSLVSAYSFNGVAADLMTTTPNDLTPQASAGYVAESPFGTQANDSVSTTLDYGIVMKATATTDTILTVQVPEGCTIPTTGTVSAVSYSGIKAPYGFPANTGKWIILSQLNNTIGGAFSVTSQWTLLGQDGYKLHVPVGKFIVGYSFAAALASSVSGARNGHMTVSSTVPTNNVYNQSELGARLYGPTGTDFIAQVTKEYEYDHVAQVAYKPYFSILSATGSETFSVNGSQAIAYMYARNTYL